MNTDVKKLIKLLLRFSLAGLLVLIVPVLNILDARSGRNYGENEQILNHRWKKLTEKGKDAEIIFLGDSSCGHGIDDVLMSQLSGKKVLNLCLTASFGIETQTLLMKYIKPAGKTFVILLSPLTMSRSFPEEGVFLTAFKTGEWSALNRPYSRKRLMNVKRAWQSLFPYQTKSKFRLEGDYFLQEAKKAPVSSQQFFVHQDKEAELAHLKEFCADKKCRFLQSPVNSGVTGITGFENPIEMKPDDFGESPEHISPVKKEEFTRKYLLKLLL